MILLKGELFFERNSANLLPKLLLDLIFGEANESTSICKESLSELQIGATQKCSSRNLQ